MAEPDGGGAKPLQDGDPRRIGGIPLLGRLGPGGMGRVYLGVFEGRYVAVKQVLPSVMTEDAGFLRRFGHELDNLARLPAEATAPLLAADRDARPPWFATGYVPGLTLREAVDVHGPLPADALWLLLREAAAGLAAVHALGMVHRDLKPSNVMLTLDGATLIDFGVARAADQSRLTATGLAVGTPAYMSPEQAVGNGASNAAVDVFALGSVIAYAAAGAPPFGEEPLHGVLYRIVHEEPDLASLRALDAGLAEVVASCLDKDHEGRPTAAELVGIAEAHGPFTPPLWPAAVAGPLAERAAFAATVPDPDRLPGPGPESESESGPEPAPGPAGPGKRERRRRTRVVLAVVPVVVVATGTTLAIQLLPHTSDLSAGARSTPSASTPAPPAPTPSASAPAGKKPDTASSRPPSEGGDRTDRDDARAAGGSAAGGRDADGGDSAGGADDPAGSGGTGTTGGPDGSGGTTGSSGSPGSTGTSGSGGDSADQGSSGPGRFALRNGERGECLVQVFNSTDTGSCTDPAASWTFRSAADGAVKIVNGSTGACASAAMNGQAVFTGDCAAGGTAHLWRPGSGGTLRSVFNGGCLDLAFGSGVSTRTCAAGTASQRWTKA
ncbi:protein kinase [Streptomyces sp. NPDC085946]|uniref:serine/threonine-protein kinase n=1 Tax=Streptomyces sp. NPDC085946 TaxID=3365744 RepID=UPI0037CE5936